MKTQRTTSRRVAIAAGLWLLAVAASAVPPPDPAGWVQVGLDGLGDWTNGSIDPAVVYRGRLIVGSENERFGGRVWAYDGSSWVKLHLDGFGNPDNIATVPGVVHENRLWFGTLNVVGGGEVWTYDEGADPQWQQVPEASSDPGNLAVFPAVVYDGDLYAGTFNYSGAEVWRLADDGWEQVNANGFGKRENELAIGFAVFQGRLYVSTDNELEGTEVWSSSDGSSWVREAHGGFGDPDNEIAYQPVVYKERLYVATVNEADGMEVWSTADGSNWVVEITDGFGDLDNTGGYGLTALDGYLYVSTRNEVSGTQLWRYDGSDWVQINFDGFGDQENEYVSRLVIFRRDLYAGTQNRQTGGEVWRLVLCPDADQDCIEDELDLCPGTAIPETVPSQRLGLLRWALVDDDTWFDTRLPPAALRGGLGGSFSIAQTGGCSCEQIIAALDLGAGHARFGCGRAALEEWIALVGG